MQVKHKLLLALAAYAGIAVLAWQTLSETKLRELVWLILGFFAFKSILHWYRTSHLEDRGPGWEEPGAQDKKV
jgi:hypothetical protein